MKKTFRVIACLALVAVLVATLAGCAKLNYVTNSTIKAIHEVKSGDWENGGSEAGTSGTEEGGATSAEGDPIVIDTFEAGTYGGIEFTSVEDVVKYYVEVFNYNKTLTAPYTEKGEAKQYYKLLGDEDLKIASLLVDGKENATIMKLVPSIMGSLFNGSPKGLPPAANRDPVYDYRDDGPGGTQLSQLESHLTADDVLACNVKDNGDGTITITIQPKAAELSFADQDSQGRFFNVLGDITGTVDQISVLSFSQGDANDNITVTYKGGYGEITVDTASKEVTKAYYIMKTHLDITHANVTIIKDKSATMDLEYTNTFPASDDFLMKSREITRG